MTEAMIPNKIVKAGEVVFREGEYPEEGIFYICSGEVQVSRQELGQTRILARLGPGDVFGEMAIINSAPRNATVTALTDCDFFTLSQQNFQHRVRQLDPFIRGAFKVFVLTIRDFLTQRDQMLQQLNEITLQMQQQPPSEQPAGGLADGVVRPMHY